MRVSDSPAAAFGHRCLIYEGTKSAQLPVVLPLLIDSLRDNWKCLYLGDDESLAMIDRSLGERGVETARERSRGSLTLTSDRMHLKDGKFEPKEMIGALTTAIDEAVSEGYRGLCATGDMRWELGADENFERLSEYEALLEQVFRTKSLRGICQYHRDAVPAHALRTALLAHQSTYMGEMLNRENVFYMPPELILGGLDASTQGEWMCGQLVRMLEAEVDRDKAVTALRASEARLAQANRDLERRVAERTAELEAANRELESFSYSVSHDLRAPLRAMSGFSVALEEDYAASLDEEARDYLRRIREGAGRMDALVNGLLEVSRVLRAEIARERVDVSAMCREIVEDLQAGDPQRAVDVTVASGLSVNGDRTLLRAVFANLISNAWKFTSKRANARIGVGCRPGDRRDEVFFVRDNGAGFDMKHVDKLFGVFQRLHANDEFQGTGVGLATVHRIVSRHGGRVWAEAAPGAGATFFIALPALTAQR
ncbi:MAG TPA: MEDS domain-containing protein [Gemmatimonadaceae bacterium]|nr:MEDS domain-containing protein [Gemmatimonadaceae bacterium]